MDPTEDMNRFIVFIRIYPDKVARDFPDHIKVIENSLENNQRTITFRVSNEFDTVDLWNAMAAGMKETYPLSYHFHRNGFSISK